MKKYKKALLGLSFVSLVPLQSFSECMDNDRGEVVTYITTKEQCDMEANMGRNYTWISKTNINVPINIDVSLPNIIEYNSKLYYSGKDSTYGSELWVTDGTVNGTKLVKDLSSGSQSSNPMYLVELNSKLYFNANNDLYESDGTTNGTSLVHPVQPMQTVIYDNKLYFQGYVDNTYSSELYSSDGTSAGTTLVKDIYSGGGSYPSYFTVFNNKLFFQAKDATYGYELYVSDGTANGTTLLKDIFVGGNNDSATPQYLTVFDNKLFFSANDGINGTELWVSDGTTAGTTLFKDIKIGGSSDASYPEYLTVSNNKLFFRANDGTNGNELWMSDGTTNGTVMVKNIYPTSNSNPMYLTNFNSKLYFQASDASGFGLWVSDGTEEGTTKVTSLDVELKNIYAGSTYLYFITSEGQIYQTDGTAANTRNIYAENITTEDATPFTNITFSQDEAKNISVTLSLGDSTKGSLSTTSIESTDMASAQTALHAVTYNSNGGNYVDKITITVDDGTNTSSYVHYIVVNITPPTAEASNVSFTIDEDTNKTFSANDFKYSSSGTLSHIIISTLESSGSLKLDGVDVTLNQEIAVSDIGKLVFTPVSNANGIPYTTFGFKVKDENATSDEYTATINVTAVDDAPTINITTSFDNVENNTSYSVTLDSTDTEGDAIAYTASSKDTTKATAAIVDGKLVVTPIAGAEGSVTVVLNAIANGKVTSQEVTIDFITPVLTSYSNLVSAKWNMISLPKGKVLNTTLLTGITSGKAVKVYRSGVWIDNPTDVNAKEAIWINPTNSTLDLSVATNDTSNDFADKATQLAYYKTLSTNEWHFVGVQYTMNWSDLTKANITPSSCNGYTFIKYYDSANDSWNTTANIPAGSGIWLRHICK